MWRTWPPWNVLPNGCRWSSSGEVQRSARPRDPLTAPPTYGMSCSRRCISQSLIRTPSPLPLQAGRRPRFHPNGQSSPLARMRCALGFVESLAFGGSAYATPRLPHRGLICAMNGRRHTGSPGRRQTEFQAGGQRPSAPIRLGPKSRCPIAPSADPAGPPPASKAPPWRPADAPGRPRRPCARIVCRARAAARSDVRTRRPGGAPSNPGRAREGPMTPARRVPRGQPAPRDAASSACAPRCPWRGTHRYFRLPGLRTSSPPFPPLRSLRRPWDTPAHRSRAGCAGYSRTSGPHEIHRSARRASQRISRQAGESTARAAYVIAIPAGTAICKMPRLTHPLAALRPRAR